MASKIKLSVESRNTLGRKVKTLRKKGIIPANVFGKNLKSTNIQLNQKDFIQTYKEAGETSLIELEIDKKTAKPVLISAIQIHPVSNQVLHVDFHQVDLKEKVTATVPVEVIGESPAVKEQGAVLFQTVSELSVEALPTDIPNSFQIDISSLTNIGDSLSIKDIKYDASKVTIDLSEDEPLVLTQEPKTQEEPELETVGDSETTAESEVDDEKPESTETTSSDEGAKEESKSE